MKIKNKKKANKKEIKKIKFVTIAYVQNFDQNFTLIALSILPSHETGKCESLTLPCMK